MKYRKVTAIIRSELLEQVEARLSDAGVQGLTVTGVMGFGEYADLFSRDWKVGHVKLEIFTPAEQVSRFVRAIVDAACTGSPGDGIVAVEPVEQLYRIREAALAIGS